MKKSLKVLIVVLCLIILGLTGFIVWDKVIDNKKNGENTNISNTISQNEDNDKTKMANEAIRNALKDQNWLKEKGIYTEINDGVTTWKPEIYIIKIGDNNEMPVYLVKTHVMDSAYTKIVTYKDGDIYVSKNSVGSDYCDEDVDIEKNIVKATSISTGMVTIYKIQDSEFEKIAEYENEDEANVKYPVESFQIINIKLTNDNIDLYVK